MSIAHLSDKNFKEEVLDSKNPVLVDFYADWCMPCKIIAPLVEELAQEYQDRVKFTKLDVDQAQAIAAKYMIMSIPTLMIFKDGKVMDQIIGVVDKATLKAKIENNL